MNASTKSASDSSSRLWREERGAEIVEMAFVLPLLLTLMIGIFWVARAFNVYETITRAAREGARVAVAPTCYACGGSFLTATGTCTSTDAVDLAIINSMAASNLPCTPGVTMTVQQHQQLQDDVAGSSTQWTVVSVRYPFQFTLPFTSLNLTTVNIPAHVQMVEEQ